MPLSSIFVTFGQSLFWHISAFHNNCKTISHLPVVASSVNIYIQAILCSVLSLPGLHCSRMYCVHADF